VRDYFVKERRLPTESTRVILNGTDTNVFLRNRARPGRNRPRFRFGTVGRLSAPKAHVTLVEAFARVAAVLPEAELHILGEGECRSDIQAAIAEHNLHDRVVLRGYSGEVANFLGSLDAFVLSSVSEGLPLVILESMAAGLPIVSTRMPGVMDVAPANEIAWYCNPGDPDALAASMIEIAGRDDLGAIGELASARAQRFSIETTWREYESLFGELLTRKRPQYASGHIQSGRESRKSDSQCVTVPGGGETTVKALEDNVY
jgi:glycosyltransferase involved in cell wall biosynthesis